MIRFSDKQWSDLQSNYDKWWKSELNRPLIPCYLVGCETSQIKPSNDLLSYANCADMSITPKQIIDRYDYELSTYEFLGDSFPTIYLHQFGAGIISAFLGAKLSNNPSTVWFSYEKDVELKDLHFVYDRNNVYVQRILDIYREGMKKWGGSVVMAFPGMSGDMDLIAIFRETTNLLMDLFDDENEVSRLANEMNDVWMAFYQDVVDIQKGVVGYTDWTGIYSKEPKCVLQCDFAYMIGNLMFKKFVLPSITRSAKQMNKTFYHLDGEGQLNHLDDLLNLKELGGIQWVPGTGTAEQKDWSAVYKKISDANKKIQAFYNIDCDIENVIKAINRPDDLIVMPSWKHISKKEEIISVLQKFNIQ